MIRVTVTVDVDVEEPQDAVLEVAGVVARPRRPLAAMSIVKIEAERQS